MSLLPGAGAVYNRDMTLLRTALENKKYELAAHILLLGLFAVKRDDIERQAKKGKKRFLQPRAG